MSKATRQNDLIRNSNFLFFAVEKHNTMMALATLATFTHAEPVRLPQVPDPAPPNPSAGAIDSDGEEGLARRIIVARNADPKRKGKRN